MQWDTAGQERFRTLTNSYYRGSHGIIVVYDASEKESFENINHWMTEIDRLASKDVVKILVGNKYDKTHKIAYNQGSELANHYGVPFLETSAKTGYNVEKVFDTIISNIYDKTEKFGSIQNETKSLLKKGDSLNNEYCCSY